MLVILALFLTISSTSYSLILEANYKPWDSTSTKYLYDYSLNLLHAQISKTVSDPIVSTDRGIYIRDPCTINLPSNDLASSPAIQDSVISMWVYFLSSGRLFYLLDSPNYLRVMVNFNSEISSAIYYIREETPQVSMSYNAASSNLYGARWRFIVGRFQQDGSNTKIYIYVNTVMIFQFTTINFRIDKHTNKWIINSNGGFFRGLIYEIWWHSGMTSISELDSVMSSNSFYFTPPSLTVPTYDFTYNSANQLCPNTCTSIYLSCDSSMKCIGASESSCYYNFLQTATNQCIFNCPNVSCTCSKVKDSITNISSFVCSCKTGYKKINDNPIACIDLRCSTYTKNGYAYTCNECEVGYTLDTDNSCKCDIGYVVKMNIPLKCAWDTFRCIEYVEGPSLYTCTKCQQGYILGCSGKCCLCDTGYQAIQESPIQCGVQVLRCEEYREVNNLYYCYKCIEGYTLDISGESCVCDTDSGYTQVISSPIKCRYEVFRCSNYIEGDALFTCSSCSEGYKLDSLGTRCICDTNAGYLEFSSNPLKCGYEVLRCSNYIEGDALFTCSSCSEGYYLDILGKSCICDEGYVKIVDNPIECTLIIDNCISYVKIDGSWICAICSTGYKIDQYGKCYDCDLGYNIVTNNPFTCAIEIYGCTVYSSYNSEWICEYCAIGYTVGCDGRCCVCDIEGGYVQVAQNPIVCTLEIDNCLEYMLYDFIWGCGVCEIGYDIDTDLRCNKCQEGYVEYSDNHFICISEIKYCEVYTLLVEGHACSKCEEGYRMCQGKCCECNLGYYAPKNNPEYCSECPSKCTKCKEFEDELICTNCSYGYIVINRRCECDLEDFYMSGDSCLVRPLEVCDINYVQVSTNPLICIERIPNCEEYILDGQTWICKTCSFGYILNSICVPEIQFCREYTIYNNLSYCKYCEELYELDCDNDYNCEYASSCKCKDGFYLSDNDACKQCPDKCSKCEIQHEVIVCLSCESNYILKDSSCIKEVSPIKSELSSILIEVPTYVTQVAVVMSCSISLLTLNLQNFLLMMGTVEILSRMILYNLNIPSRIETILKGISLFTIFPNLFEYFTPNQDALDIERYNRADITNELFLINSGKLLTVIIFILIIILILNIISRITIHLKDDSVCIKLQRRLQKFLVWNFLLGYLMQGSLELTISSLINCLHFTMSSVYSIVGLVISILILVKDI